MAVAAAEHLADDHAGDDVSCGGAGGLNLLAALIRVDVLLRGARRILCGVSGLAGSIDGAAQIGVFELHGLGAKPLGVGKLGAGGGTHHAAAGGDDVLGGLDGGLRGVHLLVV